MGCDIHLHSEVKIKDQWHHHSDCQIMRNYALFQKMANVRAFSDNIRPLSYPKGLPQDVTFLTKIHSDEMGSDGHSHSFLNSNEIEELFDWLRYFYESPSKLMELRFPFFLGQSFDGFIRYNEDWPEFVQDVRFVFFFDN